MDAWREESTQVHKHTQTHAHAHTHTHTHTHARTHTHTLRQPLDHSGMHVPPANGAVTSVIAMCN